MSGPITAIFDATPPSVPSAPTGPTQTRVKPAFSWSASSDAGSGVVAYRVYRGATLLSSTAATTFTDAGVSAGGTYRYVVRAVDAAGNLSAASDDLAVVYDTTPPTAPATPSATSPTRVRPVIAWSGGTDVNGIDHYVLVRDGVDLGVAASPWTDAAPALADGPHAYAVRAVDPAGNVSSASPGRTVTYDTTAPTAPPSVSAPSPTAGAPALTWAAATDAVGVVRYDIERDGSSLGSTTGTTFADAAVGEGEHVYTVRASDAAGNTGPRSDPRTVIVDRTAPVAPGRPAGPAITNGTVPLTWAAVDDAGSGIDHYLVYRDGAVVATTSAPAFTDGAVTLDGTYAYDVAAVDGAGNASARSATRTVVLDTTPPDTSLVAAPGLTGPAAEMVLSASEPDSTFECRLDGDAFAACSSPLLLTGLTDGGHALEVRAVDAAGNADTSPAQHPWTVDALPPDPPGLTATADATVAPSCRCASVNLQVTAPDDAVRVRVTRPGRVLLDGAAADLVDADVADGASATYEAVAYDAVGNASAPETVTVTTPDRTPPDVPVAPTGSGWPLTVTWPAVPGAAAYALQRDGTPLPAPAVSGDADDDAADTAAPAAPVGVTAQPTSTSTAHITWAPAADRGTAYQYAVAAADAAGNPSGFSAESELTATSGIDHYGVLVDGDPVADATTPAADLSGLEPGTTYLVAIVAVDAAGNASAASSTVPVAVPRAGALVVAASARPQFARPAVPVAFHAATGAPFPVTYRWVFDDGTSSAGADAAHAFARAGRHVASVTVTGAGMSATAALQVIVDGRPPQARAHVRGSRLTVDGADDLSGVASITVALSGAAPFKAVPAAGLSLADGRYAVRIRALDRAGNVVVTPFAALVDTRPPTLRVAVLGRKGRLLRVRVTAADVGSGVGIVRLDGRSLGALRMQVVLLRPGTQHLLVTTDAYGNASRLPFRLPKRA